MKATLLGLDAVEPAPGAKKVLDYKLTKHIQESKRPIYAIAFNFLDMGFHHTFAAACGNQVTLYQCLPGGEISSLQTFVDEDKNETFYTLSWALDSERLSLLVASGSNGVIRVLHCGKLTLSKSFVGHGGSVNELRTQSQHPFLVASASKDESIRFWNVQTGVCILIFAGAAGHRHEVLGVDFHPYNTNLIASCGMDNSVKIWSFEDFWTYVELSKTWTGPPSEFPTKFVQFPILNAIVHVNYVDCIRWLGDFVLSKSVCNEIILWEPIFKNETHYDGAVDILQKYPVPDCNIWFMKFSVDFWSNTLAIGNTEGKVFAWDLRSSPPVLLARLSNPQCKSPVRQTAVSENGRTILGCCEDGSILRWDAEVDEE